MTRFLLPSTFFALLGFMAVFGASDAARAYVTQADGTLVPYTPIGGDPQTQTFQDCLDKGEKFANTKGMQYCPDVGTAGSITKLSDAGTVPNAFRPVLDTNSNQYKVTFWVLGEEAWRQQFGWYRLGDDMTNPANFHPVFGCRAAGTGSYTCNSGAVATSRDAEGAANDSYAEVVFPDDDPIVFWIRTPEAIATGGGSAPGCPSDVDGTSGFLSRRMYFTNRTLNDDGDFQHFVVYRSEACHLADGRSAGFYFGFEDLYRGGDNDFDDYAILATGLVPLCDPQPETCNNVDDDCDGTVDDDLVQPCAGNACGPGTSTCVGGVWGACQAPPVPQEQCNGLNDDCDAFVDEGLSRACTSSCGNGTEVCSNGNWVGCDAPKPTIEVCDGADNDCDGMEDENLTRPCTGCGVGTEVCDYVSGAPSDNANWKNCTAPAAPPPGTQEMCNGIDDNCNLQVDEPPVIGTGDMCVPKVSSSGGAWDPHDYEIVTGTVSEGCAPGTVTCIQGQLTCVGVTGRSPEVCNCKDDDCDGQVDEGGGPSLCGDGNACLGAPSCQCASPCRPGEFPCPPGRDCKAFDGTGGSPASIPVTGNFCVPGLCNNITCDERSVCEPTSGECVDLCAERVCTTGSTCVRGRCVEQNCYGLGCAAGQRCVNAQCEADPCAGKQCATGQFCRDGSCVSACGEQCRVGQECRDGKCVDTGCEVDCGAGEECKGGKCVANNCPSGCGTARICSGTSCVDDPCFGITCPSGTQCVSGNCAVVGATPRPRPRFGVAAGGGGLFCAVVAAGAESSSTWPSGALWALALLVLGLLRRRRVGRNAASVRAGTAAAVLSIVALVGSGCSVDPYCIGDCANESVIGGSSGSGGGSGTGGSGGTVPCVPKEKEECDGFDNDCDGLIDDGIDIQTDLNHCGGCNQACNLPNAFPTCEKGICKVQACAIGFTDKNGMAIDGCEYTCGPPLAEICDGLDNDCDGTADNGFDKTTDVNNCGTCGNSCLRLFTTSICQGGACMVTGCQAGFQDRNSDPADGCEYQCTPTAPSTEVCDYTDNDCDGTVDNGFNLNTDVNNCGACGFACNSFGSNAIWGCQNATCMFQGCPPGYVDQDGIPNNGCEFGCTPTESPETSCDGADNDCDGFVDNGLVPPTTIANTACANSNGVCANSTISCGGVSGWQCNAPSDYRAPAPGGGETLCDDKDTDCDNSTDEGCLVVQGASPTHVNSNSVANASWPMVFGDGSNGVFISYFDQQPSPYYGAPRDAQSRGGVYAVGSANDGTSFGTPINMGTTGSNSAPFNGVCKDAGGEPGTFRGVGAYGGGTNLSILFPGFCDLNGDSADNDRVIWFQSSTDSGGTWRSREGKAEAAGELGGGSRRDSYEVDMTSSGSNVYAVYQSQFSGSRERHIYFVRSTNGGTSWLTPVKVDSIANGTSTYSAGEPKVAASGSNVCIVWRDNRNTALDIFARCSNDSGANFLAAEQRLDGDGLTLPSAQNGSGFSPVVAMNGSSVYVVWVEDRDAGAFDLWSNYSSNGGASWAASAVEIGSTPYPTDSLGAQVVALSSGRAVVAWYDFVNGFSDIFAARTTNGGQTWSTPARLDVGSGKGAANSFDVAIGARGERIAVAWADLRNTASGMYVNYSFDGGATWQPKDFRMDGTSSTSSSEMPSVYLSPTRVHVVWVERPSGSAGQIQYRSLQ